MDKTMRMRLKEMGKKTCEDCIGCDYCSDYDKYDISFIWSLPDTQDVRTECSRFKDKADVVPKSEIFEAIKKLLDRHSYSQCFQGEVCPTSYFEKDLEDSIAELEKKYMGERK